MPQIPNKMNGNEFADLVRIDRIVRKLMIPALFGLLIILQLLGLLCAPLFSLAILLAIYLVTDEITHWLVEHKPIVDPRYLYLGQQLLNVVLLTLVIHLTGGIESFAAFFLPLVIIMGGLVLPRGQSLILTVSCCVSYTGTLFLEYLGLIPHWGMLPYPLTNIHTDFGYMLMTAITACVVMALTGYITSYLAIHLRQKAIALTRAKAEIEEWNRTLEARVREKTRQVALLNEDLQKVYVNSVRSLLAALDAKDHYTEHHSCDVSEYAMLIAKEMGLGPEDMRDIRLACQLHDVGKIGVRDQVLLKPGPLNPEEWSEMKQHPTIGAKILEPLEFLREVQLIILQEHERWDGKGYPAGLKDEKIHLGARVTAVADAYDAMTTQRPYNKVLTKEQAIAELKRCRGTQFDPKVVDAFVRILERNAHLGIETKNQHSHDA
ncbi:MAG: HD-GYP domain-containing protein [Candidatus Omnitrophica bacterium]|nr:HD-GYP domain-containing protein [Candidatus Omnitrophota bacterium]